MQPEKFEHGEEISDATENTRFLYIVLKNSRTSDDWNLCEGKISDFCFHLCILPEIIQVFKNTPSRMKIFMEIYKLMVLTILVGLDLTILVNSVSVVVKTVACHVLLLLKHYHLKSIIPISFSYWISIKFG